MYCCLFLLFYRAEDDGRREVFQSAQEHARRAAVPARIFHGSTELTDRRGRDAGQRLPGRLHPWHTASQKEEQHWFPCEAVGDEWKRGIISSSIPRPISPATVTANTQHYWRTPGFLLKQERQRHVQVNSITILHTCPLPMIQMQQSPTAASKAPQSLQKTESYTIVEVWTPFR